MLESIVVSIMTIGVTVFSSYYVAKRLMKQTVNEVIPRIPRIVNDLMRTEEGQQAVYAAGVLLGKGALAGSGFKLPAATKKLKITGISFIDELIGRGLTKELEKYVGTGEKAKSEDENIGVG